MDSLKQSSISLPVFKRTKKMWSVHNWLVLILVRNREWRCNSGTPIIIIITEILTRIFHHTSCAGCFMRGVLAYIRIKATQNLVFRDRTVKHYIPKQYRATGYIYESPKYWRCHSRLFHNTITSIYMHRPYFGKAKVFAVGKWGKLNVTSNIYTGNIARTDSRIDRIVKAS